MAVTRFKSQHLLYRFIAALVLVFATYNPIGFSYYDWAVAPALGLAEGSPISVLKALIGLIVVVGWLVFLRATQRSIGGIGALIALLFFVLLFWFLIDQGWLSLSDTSTLSWLILIAISGIMALGMSWSHIRRRMSGQLDVDEIDGGDN